MQERVFAEQWSLLAGNPEQEINSQAGCSDDSFCGPRRRNWRFFTVKQMKSAALEDKWS